MGFAFRDKFLNGLFREIAKSREELTFPIWNPEMPDDAINKLDIPSDRVIRFAQKFDEEGMTEFRTLYFKNA